MSDGGVERRKQPLMGRRQNHDPASRPQVSGGSLELGAIALNVLQDVDINDGVELVRGAESFASPTDRLVLTRLKPELIFELPDKLAVRFHTDEPLQMAIVQISGVASNSGAR